MTVTMIADLRPENTIARCTVCPCTFSKTATADHHETQSGHPVFRDPAPWVRRSKLDQYPYHQRTGVE